MHLLNCNNIKHVPGEANASASVSSPSSLTLIPPGGVSDGGGESCWEGGRAGGSEGMLELGAAPAGESGLAE